MLFVVGMFAALQKPIFPFGRIAGKDDLAEGQSPARSPLSFSTYDKRFVIDSVKLVRFSESVSLQTMDRT